MSKPAETVAIISDFYLDYVGGAQSSMLEQKAALADAGHGVYLVANVRRGTTIDSVDLPITPAFSVPGVDLAVTYNRAPLVQRLRRYFTEKNVDVVHLQTEFGLAQAATTAAHELGLPVVHTVHTFYWQSAGVMPTLVAPVMKALLQSMTATRFPQTRFTGRPSDDTLRNMTAAMAARADVVVSPSEHQGADLAAAGVETPIVIVPNPISRSPRPASLLADDAPARFLWVARCEPEKRPLVFAAAAISALATASFEVDFVGSGSQLDELRSLTAAEPRIRVHGSLGHDAVLDLIDASSMVALTSYGFDNQPMTIAESVSRFRGVLFCDPKLREGLGDSGYLAASPDERGLADALVDLVTPGTLQKLSQGAVKDAVTFSAATYVERITAVYTRAMELRS